MELPYDEAGGQRERQTRIDERGRRQPSVAVTDHRKIEQGNQRAGEQQGTEPVERLSRRRSPRRGEPAPAERECRDAERDRKQEDGPPPEGLRQQAADGWTNRGCEYDAEAEYPHRPASLFEWKDFEHRDH